MAISSSPPSLTQTVVRALCLHLFQCQARWRRLYSLPLVLREAIRTMRIPPHLIKGIEDSLTEILLEVERWTDKHAEMFEGAEKPKMKERAPRQEHLRTYYYCLRWRSDRLEIRDQSTALEIIRKECKNWPQLKFQFACLYAREKLIRDDFIFDKYYRIAFKKRLSYHPVYDFWLTLLDVGEEKLFHVENNRAQNQRVMLCFKFAITNGYLELTKWMWNKISPAGREYIVLLQWRAMAFRVRSRETFKYLCEQMCKVNRPAVARFTWTVFYDAVYKTLEEDQQKEHTKTMAKLRIILASSCRQTRLRLLKWDNYKAITDAFYYNNATVFSLLLQHLPDSQIRLVRERIDRILDRRLDVNPRLQKLVIRRQQTLEEPPTAEELEYLTH